MDIVTKLLKKFLGDAGAGIDQSNGSDRLYDVLKGLADQARNRVIYGLDSAAPTTASTQATGVSGNLAVRINLAAGAAMVAAVVKKFAAAADTVLFASAPSPIITGQSMVFSVVVFLNAAGVLTLLSVPGLAATTGLQLAPGKTAVNAAVGLAANNTQLHWIKLCDVTVNRTADTTLTQTQDDTVGDFGAQGVAIE